MATSASDTAKTKPYAPDSEEAIFVERCADFIEAVECLYIFDNSSGRIKFIKDWPNAASYILSDALITIDKTGDDPDGQRDTLEQEAEIIRIAALEILDAIKDHAINETNPDIEVLKALVSTFGTEITGYILNPETIAKLSDAPMPAPVPDIEDNETVPDDTDTPDDHDTKNAPKDSGFNLGVRKRLVEVQPPEKMGVSYSDLLKQSEDEQEIIHSQQVIQPPQSTTQPEQESEPESEQRPLTKPLPKGRYTMLFNAVTKHQSA